MKTCARGFTLVELLVVIAIISTLAAMLLPTLQDAFESARKSQCVNNLRQLNFAFFAYVEDFARYPANPGQVVQTYPWGGKRGTGKYYTASAKRIMNAYVGFTDVPTTTSEGALLVFRCPSDVGSATCIFATELMRPTSWDHAGTSYQYNMAGNSGGAGFASVGMWNKRLTDVVRPSRAVLCNDWPFSCYTWSQNPYWSFYWHDKNQLGWGNVLFADGHVSYLMATFNKPNYERGEGWDFNVIRK